MKKLLVIALAFASANAHASRARMISLGNAAHLVDVQTIYSNPADMFQIGGDLVNLESGATTVSDTAGSSTENTNAEGIIVRSMGDAKFALALGHLSQNAATWSLASNQPGLSSLGLRAPTLTGLTGIKSQQNPINLTYGMKQGDMVWAGTLVYSNFNDKKNNEKESSLGLRAGVRMGAIDGRLGIGLINTYEKAATGKYKGNAGYSLGGGYTMDSLYVYGEIKYAGFKVENTSGTSTHDSKYTEISAGAIDNMKKDGANVFYGAKLVSTNLKDDVATATIQKKTELYLPLIVGMEVDANSWLTVRGSLTQNVLLSDTKTEGASSTLYELSPSTSTTVANIGAGLKFNKITVDGSLTGLSGQTANQNLDGNNLLTTVGMTYVF